MTSIGPLTTLQNSLQQIERPHDQHDQLRPVPPERPGDEGASRPKAAHFRDIFTIKPSV